MLGEIVQRLKTQVPALDGRVQSAAGLAEMLSARGLPQNSTTFVVPLGLQARPADDASGLFTQEFTETIGVLLVARVTDQAGSKALEEIRPLLQSVIAAIAGWTAGGAFGVFELRRGTLVGIRNGALIYMLEFSITDQLRIAT
ncbi:hypothetical protein FGK63_01755 [Ruegeria sediminis]|uniref:DUF3168 domain-containing protein n=1 Tax=Ruegeria sediminis TaxID=2583820 RepID=A0ABY2X4E3_9RHOB|nr:hypothetical protein [Ruegeria sediminis]TMV09820.1 hypothetical protein FGK63_01755 [Ruegeria sediminis]